MLDRPDVRSLDLSASTTIDKTQAGYCTAVIVGTEDVLSEVPVAHDAVEQLIDSLSSRQMLKRYVSFVETGGRNFAINPGQNVVNLSKAKLNNPDEVFR
jgi:hypothetical protein